jgi:hypothetical protein
MLRSAPTQGDSGTHQTVVLLLSCTAKLGGKSGVSESGAIRSVPDHSIFTGKSGIISSVVTVDDR